MTTPDAPRPLTAVSAYNELPTSSYSWSSSQPVLTHCIHGLDLRLNPRCYLCRPEAAARSASPDPDLAHVDEFRCGQCGDWLAAGQIVGHGYAEGRDLAALASQPEPLDAAWKAAEAALPEGGRLHVQRRAEAETITTARGGTWVARQGRAAGSYEAWATDQSKSLGFAYADTPAAALLALAARLPEEPR